MVRETPQFLVETEPAPKQCVCVSDAEARPECGGIKVCAIPTVTTEREAL